MVRRLIWNSEGAAKKLQDMLKVKHERRTEIVSAVSDILSDVNDRGDEAVLAYTNRFDRTEYSDILQLKVTTDEIQHAYEQCDGEIIRALELARERIESYHVHQLPQDHYYQDKQGVGLGWKWTAIESVGLYVPGGLAVYPSSVLMNAVPAKVAGVKRVAMVVPCPDGETNPMVLVAAKIAGVSEVYRVGGAQAIGALAYGTDAIKPVKKIVGPGNAYVAEAKRQVYGTVGIDMIAGPSEILVVADNKNNPDWIAADLLSQAEHDADARSVLITDDAAYAEEVVEAVERTLRGLEREGIARRSWDDNGIIITVDDFDQAIEPADIMAAEHIEFALDRALADRLKDRLNNAGAIFVGRYTPEAIGDYIAGPSHVLPTGCSAAFSSGLGVLDFMKRSSIIACEESSVEYIFEEASLLAKSEGLGAHALSVDVRLRKN